MEIEALEQDDVGDVRVRYADGVRVRSAPTDTSRVCAGSRP